MPGKVLNTIYFLKGNIADNSNLILLGLEKQRGITLEAYIVHFLYIIYTKYKSYTKNFHLRFWTLRVIYPFSEHQDLSENILVAYLILPSTKSRQSTLFDGGSEYFYACFFFKKEDTSFWNISDTWQARNIAIYRLNSCIGEIWYSTRLGQQPV